VWYRCSELHFNQLQCTMIHTPLRLSNSIAQVALYCTKMITSVALVYCCICLVPPENCDVAEHNFCATFGFLCKRAFFATEHNFRATLAHFGVFCGFLPFWRHFGEKWNMEPLSTHNLSEICSCLSENCNFLTAYFFHCQCHWARVARLMMLQRSL